MSLFFRGGGRDTKFWPLLVLLLIAVSAPTACLLWFMARTIENERLGVEKTLENVCRDELSRISQQWELYIWKYKVEPLSKMLDVDTPPGSFYTMVRCLGMDGLIIYSSSGEQLYPTPPRPPNGSLSENKTEEANAAGLEQFENALRFERDGDDKGAADAFSTIAEHASDNQLAARALQGKIRCLVRMNRSAEALDVILKQFDEEKFETARDEQGRLIAPNVEYLGLTLLKEAEPSEEVTKNIDTLLGQLATQLADYYTVESFPSSQRLFLMQEVASLDPDWPDMPLYRAEQLVSEVIASRFVPKEEPTLQPTPLADVFAFRIVGKEGSTAALLVTQKTLDHSLERQLKEQGLLQKGMVKIVPPNRIQELEDVWVSIALKNIFTGWRFVVERKDMRFSNAAAQQRIVNDVIIAFLAILVICGSTILLGGILRRQMQIARLKNDLVATVSHELKTPLASIRLLVETLLDADVPDQAKTRDYLQLIAKENLRLSHLIDNFLTFSRMERSKKVFQKSETDPASLVNQAADAVRERFDKPGCLLDVKIAPNLPFIEADPDAMTTVLVNLLDNAYKYTGEEKIVTLTAEADEKTIIFTVSDNGIGIPRSAQKKIFSRFYQVDRRLSRTSGGCGLGLSIVKYIVSAHDGTIDVESRPSRGSVFTVKLPINS